MVIYFITFNIPNLSSVNIFNLSFNSNKNHSPPWIYIFFSSVNMFDAMSTTKMSKIIEGDIVKVILVDANNSNRGVIKKIMM